MKKLIALAAVLSLAVALAAGCAARGSAEISQKRAIEIARQHVTFEPGKIEAKKDTENGRPVWRITFRGKGVSASSPGEFMEVTLDRRTGELVELAMSLLRHNLSHEA